MPASKIVDETEVLRWFSEGRTYAWMVSEYRRKYNIETVNSMWSNFRKRRGLDRRITRDDDLIPWHVLPEHRHSFAVQNLRAEARRRDGRSIRAIEELRLEPWLRGLRERNEVVAYDPNLGFVYVPREDGDDDIIRRPERKTTMRPNSGS